MIQGVLFDMDGVLFDTESLSLRVQDTVTAQMGYSFPKELVNQMFGVTQPFIQNLLHETYGPSFDYTYYHKACSQGLVQLIEEEGLPLKPGVIQLLTYLQDNHYPVAVASSSPTTTIERYLDIAGLRPYFSFYVGGNMVKNSKPAPDIFLQAAKGLNLSPNKCLAVEDSPNGIKSASSAGCVTLMVPDILPATEELIPLCADVLPSLKEVIPFLENHLKPL